MPQNLIHLLDQHLPPRTKIPLTSVWNFPGLSRKDTQILHDALTLHHFQPAAWWFNVPLGTTPPWGRVEGLKRFFQRELHLYKLRADLIFIAQNRIYCCEIKPEARATALGQAMLMAYLLTNTLNAAAPVYPIILCDQASPDLTDFCRDHQVDIVQLNPE